MSEIPVGGADLARQALARARAAAKTAPAAKTRTPRRTRRPAGGGRDPQGLGSILGALTADEGWADNLGGGNILDRWAELCPSAYAQTTKPTGFDTETGTLSVKAVSHTVAAHLRLMERQLVSYINQQMGRPLVRRVRVGIGGDSTPGTPEASAAAAAREPEAPVKTRDMACDGYRAALEAALTHRPDHQPTNPYVREAIERQEAALRANRQHETEHREAYWEMDRLATAQADRDEAVRRAAIARARHDRAGGEVPRRLFGAA